MKKRPTKREIVKQLAKNPKQVIDTIISPVPMVNKDNKLCYNVFVYRAYDSKLLTKVEIKVDDILQKPKKKSKRRK